MHMNGPSRLAYPFESRPAPGEAIEVRSGVLWLRMPMPFALDHINLWAIREEQGWAVVDSGLRTVDTLAAWHRLLDNNGPLAGLPVSRVVVTHMHPDHVGMAGWLTRRFKCPFMMTRLEYLSCRVMVADTGRAAPDEGVEFFRRAGWAETALDEYRTRFGDFGKMIHPLPDRFERLSDGQTLRLGDHVWEVVVGSGHSPEHASLYCTELEALISGDQVLPRISSNTSVHPTEPNADPIRDWLRSIADMRRRISGEVLVLPAHNEPFFGLHQRLSQLESFTLRDLTNLRAQLKSPKRVADLVQSLFRPAVAADPEQNHLATGEMIARLNHLLHLGEASMEMSGTGAAWYRIQP